MTASDSAPTASSNSSPRDPLPESAPINPNHYVTLLDYGAGNVRSVRNAIQHHGYAVRDVTCAEDIRTARALIFPGVGSFATCMHQLQRLGYYDALKDYVQQRRGLFLGICLGMQVLLDSSTECNGHAPAEQSKAATTTGAESNTAPQQPQQQSLPGLSLIPGHISLIKTTDSSPVPHIGWNTLQLHRPSSVTASTTVTQSSADNPNGNNKSNSTLDLLKHLDTSRFYFVHSYCMTEVNDTTTLTSTQYATQRFTSALAYKDRCVACQFHPEKSGAAGLEFIRRFLQLASEGEFEMRRVTIPVVDSASSSAVAVPAQPSGLSKRIIACLDVRENEQGDLVVTKGESYDVHDSESKTVRNLGLPVAVATRYYTEHADEITFLNITAYRGETLTDLPLLQVLEQTSKHVFVPLCIGGGIRDYTDKLGVKHTALAVAEQYFRSGADKVSIGSDAVYAAEHWYKNKQQCDGTTSIESISRMYGVQACVVSIDPRRVYVASPEDTRHACIKTPKLGPKGEQYCWYECTVKGGREARDLDVLELSRAVIALGCGELLVNSMDADGQKAGFDIELLQIVCNSPFVSVPVIASSGAGCVEHFTQVFQQTNVSAALAAGIFHRHEVSIQEVKQHCAQLGCAIRL